MIRFGLAPASAKKNAIAFLCQILVVTKADLLLNAKKVKAMAVFILEDALSVQTEDASLWPFSH